MADEKQKAQYAPSAQQVDLEERLANGNASTRVLSTADIRRDEEPPQDGRSYAVEGNDLDNYVNTSPEYMTYANETEKPHAAEEGIFKDLEEDLAERLAGAVDVSEPDEEEEEVDEPETAGSLDASTNAQTPAKKTASSSSRSTSSTSSTSSSS